MVGEVIIWLKKVKLEERLQIFVNELCDWRLK
jgi:hypothetical protein